MDEIPCTVEFSDMERENKNCALGEISDGLIKTQTEMQSGFRHLPKQVKALSLFERELVTREQSSYYLFKLIKALV